jgi:hypothetical protein
MNMGTDFQKLLREMHIQTTRQKGDLISLLVFFKYVKYAKKYIYQILVRKIQNIFLKLFFYPDYSRPYSTGRLVRIV